MLVVPSVAVLCSVHSCSRLLRKPASRASPNAANARFVGPYQVRKYSTAAGGVIGKFMTRLRLEKCISVKPSPKRSRTNSSLPHNNGEGIGGGGTCWLMILKSLPIKPSGVQFAIEISTQGRQTRIISATNR